MRVASVSDDVDRMARQLHPAPFEQFGLAATLKSECPSVLDIQDVRTTSASAKAEDALAAAHECLEQRIAERGQTLLVQIAERTRMEAELRPSRERLRHILVSAPGILYSFSPIDLAATFVSDKIQEALGYTRRWKHQSHSESASALPAAGVS